MANREGAEEALKRIMTKAAHAQSDAGPMILVEDAIGITMEAVDMVLAQANDLKAGKSDNRVPPWAVHLGAMVLALKMEKGDSDTAEYLRALLKISMSAAAMLERAIRDPAKFDGDDQ